MPGVQWPGDNYRRWSIGEADFFLLDNRRYKDPPSGPYENGRYMSVLRSTQRTWLLQGLASSTARVKFIFAPMSLAFGWRTEERQEIQTFIHANVSGPVIFLTGDRHAGAFARYSSQVWEMLACPLRNTVKATTPTRTGVIWTENGTGPALYDAVGAVDVDTVASQTVTLRLLRDNGQELHRQVVPIP
jgi:phosphodiesterase/alkaline phosphatase D-like protein